MKLAVVVQRYGADGTGYLISIVNFDFTVIDSQATLVWTANLAAIELHPSLSLAAKPEEPTMVVFDLDPAPDVDFDTLARDAMSADRSATPGRPATPGWPGTAGWSRSAGCRWRRGASMRW